MDVLGFYADAFLLPFVACYYVLIVILEKFYYYHFFDVEDKICIFMCGRVSNNLT
jgi:hypothetical protein